MGIGITPSFQKLKGVDYVILLQTLSVLWMPKYSPNLNLIERVWGHLKRSALANVFHGTVGRLVVAIARAVRAFNDRANDMMRILFAAHHCHKPSARNRAA